MVRPVKLKVMGSGSWTVFVTQGGALIAPFMGKDKRQAGVSEMGKSCAGTTVLLPHRASDFLALPSLRGWLRGAR